MPSLKPQVVSYIDPADMKRLDHARAHAAKWAGVPISRSAYVLLIIKAYLAKKG